MPGSNWELHSSMHRPTAANSRLSAAELVPAPSAQLAGKRFAEMKEDPDILALVKVCRELQWCHATYLRAEQLAEKGSGRARQLFEQIVQRAPNDSEVYRAALSRIEGPN